MREQRRRKALYVNRREELYSETLLRKEYAAGEKRSAPKGSKPPRRPRRLPMR